MIIFAQLCYCIYYENYYNSFIMKNKKNNFYLMGVVFIAILGGLLFGYDTAVISGAEQALQKHLGLDAFWHGVTASSALIGCVIGSAFSGYFASGLGRRNSLRLAALLFFLSALGSYYPEFLFFSKGDTSFALILAFNFYRIIGGIGGDEFIAFIKNIPSKDFLIQKLEKLRYTVVPFRGILTYSMGICLTSNYGFDFEVLYEKADIALYHSKARGTTEYSLTLLVGMQNGIAKPC